MRPSLVRTMTPHQKGKWYLRQFNSEIDSLKASCRREGKTDKRLLTTCIHAYRDKICVNYSYDAVLIKKACRIALDTFLCIEATPETTLWRIVEENRTISQK